MHSLTHSLAAEFIHLVMGRIMIGDADADIMFSYIADADIKILIFADADEDADIKVGSFAFHI